MDRRREEPDAPGPTPDRAAAELAEAEWNCRHAIEHEQVPSLDWSLPIVLAELDRQRVIVRAAEALVECDAAKPGLGQSISVWRRQRRELLDALAVAVRALLEGEGAARTPVKDYMPEHRHQCECGHHVSVHEAGHRASPNRCIIGDCPCTEYRGPGEYQ